ncbi:MAG TPA: hypothetical protein PKX21_01455 [Candidatus Pacearchaeota archaeon]|nr:hypothetical protein [Candidatus Pacearchaeota archaeon]
MKNLEKHFWKILAEKNDNFLEAIREAEKKYVGIPEVWFALDFRTWRRIFFCAENKQLKRRALREIEVRARSFHQWAWVYLAARESKDRRLAKRALAMMDRTGDRNDWRRVTSHLDLAGQKFAKDVLRNGA